MRNYVRKRNRKVKGKTPEVLWRLFGKRARTLAKAITSLMFSHSCQRKHDHSLCLQCRNAMSYLITPLDPHPYRELLHSCFVVFNDNAPPIGEFSTENRWSQHEVVTRSIEMVMREQSKSSCNVLCNGYDKRNRSGESVELLTSPSWSHLLKRVGDDVMIYLLRHSSIFLGLPSWKHQQVAGPAIGDLVNQLRKHAAESQHQQSSNIQLGTVDCNGSNYIRPCSKSSGDRPSQVSFYEAATENDGYLNRQLGSSDQIILQHGKRLRPSRIQCYKKYARLDVNKSTESIYSGKDSTEKDCKTARLQHDVKKISSVNLVNLCEAAELKAATDNATQDENSNGQVVDSNQKVLKHRKRSRPFRWERRKKHARLVVKESSDGIKFTKDSTEEGCLATGFQNNFNNISTLCRRKMPPQCSCCLLFQAPYLITEDAQIDRKLIFYNLEQSSFVLPQNHMLISLSPNAKGLKFLLASIFGLSDVNPTALIQCSQSNATGSTCLYRSLLEMLKTIIRQTRRCKHLKLLDKHCVVPSLNQSTVQNSRSEFEGNFRDGEFCKKSNDGDAEQCERSPDSVDPQIEAVKSYCSKDQVVSFIWAVCRSLIPPSFLGTKSNWRILRRNISKLIQLRRFENFTLKQCMHKLKTSEFPFLSDKCPSCCLHDPSLNSASGRSVGMHKRAQNLKFLLLKRWIFWFFSSLVVPLVQANFYVTESQHRKLEVFYYKKSSWKQLIATTVDGLNSQNYHCLDAAKVYSISSRRSFGFSNLRLLPKANGIRMLANLKTPSKMAVSATKAFPIALSTAIQRKAQSCKSITYKYFKAVNSVLRDTHAVLKGIQLKEPDMLGCSVFDYNSVYKKLCPFIVGLRTRLTKMPDVYVVVSDVSKAFDSIDQDKLLSVMKDVILNDEYLLQESYQVVRTKKSLWNHRTLNLMDPNIRTDFTRSCTPFGSLHGVLVNQVRTRHLTKEKLLFNLYEHVKRNVLVLDKKFYLQGTGISQGSVLSCLLCSLYYGHLERNVIFPFLEKFHEPATGQLLRHHSSYASATRNSSMEEVTCDPRYMLLRFIDDLLFISTSKKQAAGFFSRMQRGFRDYNCYMNKEKFGVSFDVGNAGGLTSDRVFVGEDGILFLKWSGLLLNSSTLEVQADYTRYWNNNLRTSLNVCWQTEGDRHLKRKLFGFMRPKCHPLFFDSNINSSAVVRLNIYQAFLISAMKFHCYVSDTSYICKLLPKRYSAIIKESLRYMYSLIRRKMSSVHLGFDFRPVLQLEAEEVEWLGLRAFIQVLKRKPTRHKELILLLMSELSAHSFEGKNVSSPLEFAVDPIHSSVIWKIKY